LIESTITIQQSTTNRQSKIVESRIQAFKKGRTHGDQIAACDGTRIDGCWVQLTERRSERVA
jgi:hypothetical protein